MAVADGAAYPLDPHVDAAGAGLSCADDAASVGGPDARGGRSRAVQAQGVHVASTYRRGRHHPDIQPDRICRRFHHVSGRHHPSVACDAATAAGTGSDPNGRAGVRGGPRPAPMGVVVRITNDAQDALAVGAPS